MIKIINLYAEAQKHYNNLLVSYLTNDLVSFFPLHIKFSKPQSADSREEQKKKIEYLIDNSISKKTYGYKIKWKETVKTREKGEITLPETIYFENCYEYLLFINKSGDYEIFQKNVTLILYEIPELKNWIINNVNKINLPENNWGEIAKVCRYFIDIYNPENNLYIRELAIEIHTKFIEENKSILNSIFTDILPKNKINEEFTGITNNNFEKRYYLNYNKPAIRFRILDNDLLINNISDICILIEEFEYIQINCNKIFIVENLMNFLAFPKVKNAIVIWGEGNKVNTLKTVRWIAEKKVYYWGDIDFAGLHILSNVREFFPHIISFLMTTEIFDKYLNYSVIPETEQNKNMPKNLQENELNLFNQLLKITNEKVRLEQEHIPQCELLYLLLNI